ncbi:MAG: ABC transporter permease [Thermomicrobiales bacterium]|nr:ABC transporter permease [Thermomicrobiales bacterium]
MGTGWASQHNAAWRSTAVTVGTSILAVTIALLAGAVFIAVSGHDPIESYRALWNGAFGSRRAVGETLAASVPYIFGGLSFAIAYRAGMFNIGIEGQMVMGGLAAGLFAGWDLGLPAVVYVPTSMALALLAGGLWGSIAGVLKAATGAHEVITTIMLNYLAFRLLSFTVLETDKHLPVDPQLQATHMAPPEARLPIILSGTRLHAGLIVGILAAILLWYLLFRTTFGYNVRTVGLSRGAAAYAGIRWGSTVVAAMFVSGGMAGLGGGSETIGLLGQQYNSPQGYGFTSIAVGLVGRNHPIGVIAAALVFGVLRSGSNAMQNQVGTSREIVLVLQGLVILAIAGLAASGRIKAWWARRRRTTMPTDEFSNTIGVEPGVTPEL